LTCYKEALEEYQASNASPATIYINREAYIAQTYAGDQLTILEKRGAENQIESGDLILINTRTNEDLKTYKDAPVILQVGRAGATFCVIKQIP
jgi:hypothetical protein